MITLNMAELAEVLGGRLVGDGAVRFHGVNRDSRTLAPETLFVALQGDRFDGHDFIGPGLAAAGLLVTRDMQDPRPQVVVRDTTTALADLALFWRGRTAARVVALTGSNGKTTTKEMLRAILAGVGSVHATQGNLNNHIGVPLTLLAMPEALDYAVIEMGANHAGEIAYLARYARPDVALITNAGRAHLDGFGSVEGVSRAKGEIYSGLPDSGGVAIVNLDDVFAEYWLSLNAGRKCIGFSLQGLGEVRGVWHAPDRLTLSIAGDVRELRLGAPGRHAAQNALAAAAAAHALECSIDPIARGLKSWRPVAGRMNAYVHASGARIWDDTYNANPDSLTAALEVLATYAGIRVLVLGDMNELGHESRDLHAQMGRRARELGVTHLLALGEFTTAAVDAFGAGATWFPSHAALSRTLADLLHADTTVLVKGSRNQHMEDILTAFDLHAAGQDPGGQHAARAG
ncbi:MAG TPA: UDP-N-acetylmuramoyl-tripeptide--D-alanyl-D-alanine ligase [Thioalkalivibrio sp.]|nr:UDP-N-acetylmuramoyl-tripeptide--D-alanyl-D-alanine ligase [Thioalkalivibrio sp.]